MIAAFIATDDGYIFALHADLVFLRCVLLLGASAHRQQIIIIIIIINAMALPWQCHGITMAMP